MKTYEALYNLATAIELDWQQHEAVARSQAEQLVAELKGDVWAEQIPEFNDIINYAAAHEDWDSGVVANWPSTIINQLEMSDKAYGYRSGDNDDWVVFGAFFSGEEDIVGHVETETIAELLVKAMTRPWLLQET